MALVGLTGSGKTTLVELAGRLYDVTGGRILLDGREITGGRSGESLNFVRRRVGMVFQQFNLFPNMTALGNVTIAPKTVLGRDSDESRRRGIEQLGRVGLSDKVNEYPDRLSGGQQQRVAIARALAMNPEVMLFDEVTSALDPELVGEVLDLLTELKGEGVTMLLNTHEMGFARDVADQVCFLHDGVVHEAGTPDQVLTHPQQERTRAFLSRLRT